MAGGAACVFVLIGASAVGQELKPEPQVEGGAIPAAAAEAAPNAPDASEVYVNDSLEAADALAKAADMAQRRRWSQAAETLHQISESVGDRLVQSGASDSFVSVRVAVARMVASWPEPGRAAYGALAEPALQSALRRHADTRRTEPILQLFERYFATSTAAVLADRIAEAAIESGEFGLAESIYRRVLSEHPDALVHRDSYAAKLEVVAVMQGKLVEPEKPDSRLQWKGQEQPLAEVLDAVRQEFSVSALATSQGEWPIFGGERARNQAMAATIGEPGLLWRTSLSTVDHAESEDGTGTDWSEPARGPASRAAAMFPVVGAGRIYVQRNREVIALHLSSGAVAWRYAAESAGESVDLYPDDRPAEATSPTYAQERVLAAIPTEDPVFYQYDPARRGAELLCLDADDGRLLWRVDARSLQMKPGELALDTSPLVTSDSVYAVVRRRRTFGFEDSYLCRIRLADGSLVYRVHLGSSSTGAYVQRAATVPALSDGLVYACSGLGTVSAVSAYTGEVKWVRTYARRHTSDGPAVSPAPSSRVVMNPVVRWDDRVVVLPPDADELHVFAADSGATLARMPRSALQNADTLLGVHGALLCATGDKVICYDLGAGSVRMQSGLKEGQEPAGRGMWAGEELLVPTTDGLTRFGIQGGKPEEHRWDGQGRGGNLLAMPDRLIVAEMDSVAAYVPKANIWKTLRERMHAAPSDPLPAVELAEVAIGAGEYLEAMEVLREAGERMSQSTSENAALRKRLFNDVLKLASTLVVKGETSPVMLQSLCDAAGQYAASPSANVEFRLKFGRLFERIERPAAAVRLYQQILLDRTLRAESTDSSGIPQAAGAVAERRISGIILEHGPDIYGEYEAEAELWLSQAEQSGDEELFRRIIESFPNAQATGRALVSYADALSAGGRAADAWRLYVRAYSRYGEIIDRVALVGHLIDALIDLGKPELAWRWLQKVEREVPAAALRAQNAGEMLDTIRKELGVIRGPMERVLPTISPPLRPHLGIESEPGSRLMSPRLSDISDADWSRFFVRSPEGIQAYSSPTAERLWLAAAEEYREAELLLVRRDVVVLATLYEIIALEGSTGVRKWSHGRKPDHVGDPGGDWEQGGAFRTHAVQDDVLLSVRDNGEIQSVAISNGNVRWRHNYRPAAFGRVSLADPWVIYHVMQEGRTSVLVLDADTGLKIAEVVTDESRPVEDLFATIDGRAIVVTSRAISAYDLLTNAKSWSIELSGQIRPGSLAMDGSNLYFSDNGLDLQKVDLNQGAVEWQSERVADRGVDDLVVQLVGDSLLASTPTSVTAIDVHTGLRQWEATVPPRPRLELRILCAEYLLAVDTGGEIREQPSMLYFYNHANGGGGIPPGGGVDLGRLSKIRGVLVVDGGVVLETEGQIRVWLQPQ